MNTKRLTFLIIVAALIVPLGVQGIFAASTLPPPTPPPSTNSMNTPAINSVDNPMWLKVNSSLITVEFPRNGSKPLFIWWYNSNPNETYIVNFEGLTEFYTFQAPYFNNGTQADSLTIKQLNQIGSRQIGQGNAGSAQLTGILGDISNLWNYSGHPANLLFSECGWALQGPSNITASNGKVIGLTFTFNLTRAPEPFAFAVNNVAIRIRFYYVSVTEIVGNNLYNYTVGANEMKLDFIVKNWKWNLAIVQPLLNQLKEDGFNVPQTSEGLTLEVSLSSFNRTKLQNVLNNPSDAVVQQDANLQQVLIQNQPSNPPISLSNNQFDTNETPIMIAMGIHDFYKLNLASNNQTFGGYFKFVASALIENSTGTYQVPVKAAYSAYGPSLNLYMCYPYFNGTLIHDPSIGVDVPTTITTTTTTSTTTTSTAPTSKSSYQISVGTTPSAPISVEPLNTISGKPTAPQILTVGLVIIFAAIASVITVGIILGRSKRQNLILRSF